MDFAVFVNNYFTSLLGFSHTAVPNMGEVLGRVQSSLGLEANGLDAVLFCYLFATYALKSCLSCLKRCYSWLILPHHQRRWKAAIRYKVGTKHITVDFY